MHGDAVSPAESSAVGPLTTVAENARAYIRQSKAANTRRAYRSDWAHFEAWCAEHRRMELPAAEDTLALYFSDLAFTHKTSTLQRRVSSISQAHGAAGFESPMRRAGDPEPPGRHPRCQGNSARRKESGTDR